LCHRNVFIHRFIMIFLIFTLFQILKSFKLSNISNFIRIWWSEWILLLILILYFLFRLDIIKTKLYILIKTCLYPAPSNNYKSGVNGLFPCIVDENPLFWCKNLLLCIIRSNFYCIHMNIHRVNFEVKKL